MSKKELKVEFIVVSYENGNRIERNWDDFDKSEQDLMSEQIIYNFMDAIGFKPVSKKRAS